MECPTMKAAYIRREWFERATQLLPDAQERLSFYEAIIDYSLNKQAHMLSGAPAIMFEMVRSAIEEDQERYAAKCVRNRNNAKRKPVAASGSQWQPLAPTTTPTTTTTTTPTTTPTTTLSSTDIEKEKFLIVGIFFNRGAIDCIQEATTFWNYYDSLGWRNNKGAAIVSKSSAATMWRMQGDTIADATQRNVWYKCFKSCPVHNCAVWTSFERCVVQTDGKLQVFLNGSDSDTQSLIELLDTKCVAQLRILMTAYNASSLEYCCRNS